MLRPLYCDAWVLGRVKLCCELDGDGVLRCDVVDGEMCNAERAVAAIDAWWRGDGAQHLGWSTDQRRLERILHEAVRAVAQALLRATDTR